MDKSEDRITFDQIGLLDQCTKTIQFEFGTICDEIQRMSSEGFISRGTAAHLKQKVRFNGNRAINVISNHIEQYDIQKKDGKGT